MAEARNPLTEDTLAAMLLALAHRGPDDQGMVRFQCAGSGHRVFLGHRRLAIIDPEGARQPMRDAAAGLALTFNGEIYSGRELRDELVRYGYRLARDSDTEVLLRAYQHWGSGVVSRLRGMFAFAIWDERDESLFLARDRFGEKPLFFAARGSGLVFASEIKALLRVGGIDAGVNLDAVRSYFAYRYVPGPATLFAGVRKLSPGTTLVWRRGVFEQRRYWSAPDREARTGAPRPEAEAVAEFRFCLEEAVKLQMVSDVPFGAFLSGGIDSSMVVALMCRQAHGATIKTFSAGFADSRHSELPYAAAVAREFGTPCVVIDLDIVERDGQVCACGKRGCRESVSAVPAIVASARRMVDQGSGTRLAELAAAEPHGLNLDTVARAARLVEPAAQRAALAARRVEPAAAAVATRRAIAPALSALRDDARAPSEFGCSRRAPAQSRSRLVGFRCPRSSESTRPRLTRRTGNRAARASAPAVRTGSAATATAPFT